MASIYDVEMKELVNSLAEKLKEVKELNPPEWTIFVKTGASRERPPSNDDWWYVRAASIMKTLYKVGPVGISKLRKKYGGKKNRGYKPERFYLAGGNIIRKILQQFEKAGLVKFVEKGVHKGRILTPKGISLINKVASEIYKKSNKDKKVKITKEKEVKEEKKVKKHKKSGKEAKKSGNK